MVIKDQGFFCFSIFTEIIFISIHIIKKILLLELVVKKNVSNHKKNKKELDSLYNYIQQTEKNRRKEYETFLETTSERFMIPKDVVAGQSIISMIGNHEIQISNYCSIAEYSTEYIKLTLHKKSILIQGKNLMIEYSRKEEIKIIGNIITVSFVQ